MVSNCQYGNTRLEVQLSTVTKHKETNAFLARFLDNCTNQGEAKQILLEEELLERTD